MIKLFFALSIVFATFSSSAKLMDPGISSDAFDKVEKESFLQVLRRTSGGEFSGSGIIMISHNEEPGHPTLLASLNWQPQYILPGRKAMSIDEENLSELSVYFKNIGVIEKVTNLCFNEENNIVASVVNPFVADFWADPQGQPELALCLGSFDGEGECDHEKLLLYPAQVVLSEVPLSQASLKLKLPSCKQSSESQD